MHFHFAIIGGGLAATSMLAQFVDRLRALRREQRPDPAKIHIHLFEIQDRFGPGFPHSDKITLPFHITNMCASDMGIFVDAPDDFQNWAAASCPHLTKTPPGLGRSPVTTKGVEPACRHYPRALMGEYLKVRFQEAVDKGREIGMHVHLCPQSEVVDLFQGDDGIRLRIENLASGNVSSRRVDRVLLATGHWSENPPQGRYFSSPWPAEKLRRSIPPGAKVAVIGTSLSAIETLLTLTSDGEFIRSKSGGLHYRPPQHSRMFTLYSRKGLLPKVRGRLGNYKNKFLNRKGLDHLLSRKRGRLTLQDVFHLLNSDLENAYGQKIDWRAVVHPAAHPAILLQQYLNDALHGDGPDGDIVWQTVLYQSFDMVREVYLNLALEERKTFDTRYTSLFFTHAATQPAINAEKLLALMKAGIVKVVKLGSDYRLNTIEGQGCYEFVYRDDGGNEKKDAYPYVVNARGQQRSYKTNPTLLAQHLIESGTVQLEEIRPADEAVVLREDTTKDSQVKQHVYRTGSIWIDPDTHQVMQVDREGLIKRCETIYAVGAMTRGQIIDASMARGIVLSTDRIAEGLLALLAGR